MFMDWKVNVVKVSLSKAIYKFNKITTKIPMTFFSELEQLILRFTWYHKEIWIVKAILREKRRNNIFWLQTIAQSYNNENSMALAQKTNTEMNEI